MHFRHISAKIRSKNIRNLLIITCQILKWSRKNERACLLHRKKWEPNPPVSPPTVQSQTKEKL